MLTSRRSMFGASALCWGALACTTTSDVDAVVRIAVDDSEVPGAEPDLDATGTETESDPQTQTETVTGTDIEIDPNKDALSDAGATTDVDAQSEELMEVDNPRDAGALMLPDAGPCMIGSVMVVTRYRFFLRDSERCLGLGAPVLANGFYTWYARATDYCEDPGTLWQLVQSGTSFELRNVVWNMNVQIQEQGGEPGDDALLFPPINDDHQRFVIRERDGGYAAFSPVHAPTMCLSAGFSGRLELARCVAGASPQEWSIYAEPCEPPPPAPSTQP